MFELCPMESNLLGSMIVMKIMHGRVMVCSISFVIILLADNPQLLQEWIIFVTILDIFVHLLLLLA